MKGIITNVFSGLVLYLICFLINRFNNPNTKLGIEELYAHLTVLVVFVLISICVWFNKKRNKLAASQKFDFKFCAESDNMNLKMLYNMFDKKSDQDIGMATIFVSKTSPNYIPAKDFFSPQSEFMKIFRCRSIRTAQKPGKIFLQLSYLPLDKSDNTLIVKRLSDNHSGQSMLGEHPELAFISFSPVPPKYHANDFNESESYYNEVPIPWGPMEEEKPQFEELGAVLRRDKKNA